MPIAMGATGDEEELASIIRGRSGDLTPTFKAASS